MKEPSSVIHGPRFNVVPFCTDRVERRPRLHEFLPYYQPIVDLHSGCISGLELLARWDHPTAGLRLPEEFVPQAESEGWIGDLTCALLSRALSDMQGLPGNLCLSINLSPLQLLDQRLPAKLAEIAHRARFPLQRLKAEITENALVQDQARALTIARELKERGCKLSLDDFGIGYSSLLHLQSLPFDELKIDRSFVASMLERKESRKIVSAVIGLGRSLGISTVAEGIEHPPQVKMLNWLGCDLGQGWLYGRPMRIECLRTFLPETAQVTPQSTFTEQELELETAAEQIAELRALYHGAPVSLAFLDTKLRYRNLNLRMAEMNGVSVQEHLGRHVRDILPDLFPLFEPYLQRALAGEAMRDVAFRLPSPYPGGEVTRWISYQPARDEAGEVIGVSVAVVDPSIHVQEKASSTHADGSLITLGARH